MPLTAYSGEDKISLAFRMVHKTNQKAVLKKRFLRFDKENCLKEHTILIHLENESSFAQLYLDKT